MSSDPCLEHTCLTDVIIVVHGMTEKLPIMKKGIDTTLKKRCRKIGVQAKQYRKKPVFAIEPVETLILGDD